MQRYVNNFHAQLDAELASDVLTLSGIDLPQGSYRLSLCETWPPAPPIEVITATVLSDDIRLARGIETTEPRTWPAGTHVYAGVTAGMLADLSHQITDLRARILDVQAESPDSSYFLEIDVIAEDPADWDPLLLRSITKYCTVTEFSEALDMGALTSPVFDYQIVTDTDGSDTIVLLDTGPTRINIGAIEYPGFPYGPAATEIRLVFGDDTTKRGVVRMRRNPPFGDPTVILAEVPFGVIEEPTTVTVIATASNE